MPRRESKEMSEFNISLTPTEDIIMVLPEEYNLTLLRNQLDQCGLNNAKNIEKRHGTTSPMHIAFAQRGTTPPTSPQPKDLLRYHLKSRKNTAELNNSCHIMYVDGMDVRSHVESIPPSISTSRSSICDDDYYREGMRKRKSTHIIDEEYDDQVSMPVEENDELDEIRCARNLQKKIADFQLNDSYGLFPKSDRCGNFAACS